MSKEFIPYEEALAMKELGFDEPCLMVYNYKKQVALVNKIPFEQRTNQPNPYLCTAPLYQQAFRWFREKYGLVSYLRWNESYSPISWEWVIEGEEYGGETECKKGWTYKEAELACLRKLIETVNQNKDE